MAIYALHQSNKYCSIKLFHFISFFLVIYLNEKKKQLDFSLRINLNNNNNWEKKEKKRNYNRHNNRNFLASCFGYKYSGMF